MPNVKDISDDVLKQLLDAKQIEQLSWKDLPQRYKEITGDTADWRTLKGHVIARMGGEFLPERVSKITNDAIRQAFEDANAVTLAMRVLWGAHEEWNILYSRHLRSMAITPEDAKDAEAAMAPPLSEKELLRMDNLRHDITSFFFTGITMMKSADESTGLLQQAFGLGATAAAAGAIVGASGVTSTLADDAAETTRELLEDLNERHRLEGIGHHRPRIVEVDEYGDNEDTAGDTR